VIEAVHPSLRVRLSSLDRAHAAEERERRESERSSDEVASRLPSRFPEQKKSYSLVRLSVI